MSKFNIQVSIRQIDQIKLDVAKATEFHQTIAIQQDQLRTFKGYITHKLHIDEGITIHKAVKALAKTLGVSEAVLQEEVTSYTKWESVKLPKNRELPKNGENKLDSISDRAIKNLERIPKAKVPVKGGKHYQREVKAYNKAKVETAEASELNTAIINNLPSQDPSAKNVLEIKKLMKRYPATKKWTHEGTILKAYIGHQDQIPRECLELDNPTLEEVGECLEAWRKSNSREDAHSRARETNPELYHERNGQMIRKPQDMIDAELAEQRALYIPDTQTKADNIANNKRSKRQQELSELPEDRADIVPRDIKGTITRSEKKLSNLKRLIMLDYKLTERELQKIIG